MPPSRGRDLRDDELLELEQYLPEHEAIAPEFRDTLDHALPEELRAWFEQLSPAERHEVLTASSTAVMAGRRWAEAKWQTFRAHPSWSHFMQALVARRHQWRMLRAHGATVTWCRRKDKEERRIARIVAILHALRRARDRVLRGR